MARPKILSSLLCLVSAGIVLAPLACAGGNDLLTLEKQPVPSSPYIVEGACPYEGCHYDTLWEVAKPTKVYNAIGSKTVLKTLTSGQKVRVLSGKIITVPTHLLFNKDYNGFKAGKKAYLLEYLGESHTKVWYNNHFVSDDTLGCFHQKDAKQDSYCQDALKAATVLSTGKSDWWVNVALSNSRSGWARVEEGNLYVSE